MKTTLNKSAVAGIAAEVLYFISVTLFLITQSGIALTFWEIMTVVGAIIMLLVLTMIADAYKIKAIHNKLMQISLSGTVFLTSVAHFTSIGVIRKLESQGVAVPDYFKIGTFPSIEMTTDYIAWGLFMGLAFFAFFLGVKDKMIKTFSVICGILCIIGFIGSFFSASLWYAAPFGYGIGFFIMCVFILRSCNDNR